MKKRKSMRGKIRGFTLIELVVVISILAILAALAIPRFIDLQSEARTSAVEGLGGSVRSAAALAHAQWLAESSPSTIDMEGNTITLANGYPNLATIDDTLVDFTGFTYNDSTGVFTKDGAPTPASCSVTYAQPASSGDAPSITVTTTGC
ncbi:MAG: type II secretion system protein [Gammaproteobacteria bacterium]